MAACPTRLRGQDKEAIAIQEANRLGIPVAAIVDSNSDPDNISYPIPGNDDAGRAITLYCDLISRAVLDGISGAGPAGVDIGRRRTPGGHPRGRGRATTTAPCTGRNRRATRDSGGARRSRSSCSPPAGEPDDLKKITGVGPSLERKLRELGVTKLDQIANLSDEDMEKIDVALNSKGRIQRDDWVGQARALVSGA
jgi:small subunit ribosomal protein S2